MLSHSGSTRIIPKYHFYVSHSVSDGNLIKLLNLYVNLQPFQNDRKWGLLLHTHSEKISFFGIIELTK